MYQLIIIVFQGKCHTLVYNSSRFELWKQYDYKLIRDNLCDFDLHTFLCTEGSFCGAANSKTSIAFRAVARSENPGGL